MALFEVHQQTVAISFHCRPKIFERHENVRSHSAAISLARSHILASCALIARQAEAHA